MSSQLDNFLDTSFKRRRQIAALAAIAAVISSLIALAHYITPLVKYEGWLMSGFLSIADYEIEVAGKDVVVRPLDSVSLISYALLLFSVLSLAFAALAAFAFAKQRERLFLESVVISAFSSALGTSLLFSIMRVVVEEILPSLPQRGSISTPAGTLVLEASKEYKSLLYVLYEDYGLYLLVLSAVLFALSALTLYSRWRVEEGEVELHSK